MSAMPKMTGSQKNHLLAALSTETQDRLQPHLELVHLPRGAVLHGSGEKPRYSYFPMDAIIAKLALIENGASTEVYMVGNEGLVGISAVMSGLACPMQAVVQCAGYAYRISGKRLNEEFSRHGEMMALLLRYTQALITQTAQTAMCNRHHSVDQQLSRMLLHLLDRLATNELAITQESLANMLGVRRESVTDAAGRMKHLGLIECRRGRMRVVDRPGIEKRCCECYGVVRKEVGRLLPYTASMWSHSPIPRPRV